MNLHLLDDEKVVDRTIAYFNSARLNHNKFIVLCEKDRIKYVKKREDENVFFAQYGSKNFWQLIGNTDQYQQIIIHYLCEKKIRFINRINHPSISWIPWGGDLYNDLLKAKGYTIYKDEGSLKKIGLISFKRRLLFPLAFLNDKFRLKRKIKAISKINIFHGLEIEYEILKSYYVFPHLSFRDFFYYPIDDVINLDSLKEYSKLKDQRNIMIGNSASLSANHLEVIKILQIINLKNKRYIFPLSYGSVKYRDAIISYGNLALGSQFFPKIGFVPLEEYNKTLFSCAAFIFGNLRQEALGNILVALFSGGKVFLYPENPLFKLFKSQGVVLFSINDINEEILNDFLEEKFVIQNRETLIKLFNKEKLMHLINANF